MPTIVSESDALVIVGKQLEVRTLADQQKLAEEIGGRLLFSLGIGFGQSPGPIDPLYANRDAWVTAGITSGCKANAARSAWGELLRSHFIAYENNGEPPQIKPGVVRLLRMSDDPETRTRSSNTLLSLASVDEIMEGGNLRAVQNIPETGIIMGCMRRTLDTLREAVIEE